MVAFMVFVFGLAVGSFLNAFIYRLELREGLELNLVKHKPSVLQGRSFCPHCGHTLAWYDLIPLLSFLLLRGECKYCSQKISLQYPLIELVCGLLFVAIFIYFVDGRPQHILYLGYLWVIASSLIGIFVYDLKHFLIPDKVLYPAILVYCIWYLVSSIFFQLYTKYEILNTIYSA